MRTCGLVILDLSGNEERQYKWLYETEIAKYYINRYNLNCWKFCWKKMNNKPS